MRERGGGKQRKEGKRRQREGKGTYGSGFALLGLFSSSLGSSAAARPQPARHCWGVLHGRDPTAARSALLGSTPRQSSPAHVLAGLLIMAQASLARFVVANAAAFPVEPGMVTKFEELVYTDLIAAEIKKAQEYLAGPAAIDNHMQPMGVTVSKKLYKDVFE